MWKKLKRLERNAYESRVKERKHLKRVRERERE